MTPSYQEIEDALVEWGRWHVLTELRHPSEFALWGLANRLVAARAGSTAQVSASVDSGRERANHDI